MRRCADDDFRSQGADDARSLAEGRLHVFPYRAGWHGGRSCREDREAQLKALWGELSRYPLQNEGRFPARRDAEVIPVENWSLPAVQYHYLEGRNANEDGILAFEPDAFEDGQLALMTSGENRIAPSSELAEAVKQDGEE